MTLALIALVVLAVVVFAFVLEPIVRARSDQTVLDVVALPQAGDLEDLDDDDVELLESEAAASLADDDAHASRQLTIDRPASVDAS